MPLGYTAIDQFPPSPTIYDTPDLVLGGVNGPDNTPFKQLFDRTTYLFNRLGRFEDVLNLAGNYTYQAVDYRKLFAFVFSGANAVFNLPDATTFTPGYILPIVTEIASLNALSVITFGSQQIRFGSTSRQTLYLHDGEILVLVAAGNHWKVLEARGNFDNVGDTFHARAVRKNTLISQGQTINRVDFPRLFEFLKMYLVDGVEVVSDAIWLSDPLRYRSLFSWGDGTATTGTTFRVPDERGMFNRSLDLGRGIDFARADERAGGYEADKLKAHEHYLLVNDFRGGPAGVDLVKPNEFVARKATSRGSLDYELASSGDVPTLGRSGVNKPIYPDTESPGLETTVKNIGKIPLIYF